MLDITNSNPEICIIGRVNFSCGIGLVTFSACELLARHYPICIYPTDLSDRLRVEPHPSIRLPNDRKIPVCKDLSTQHVFFFTDVLWNGANDFNYQLVPKHGFRIAHVSYDSTEFPPEWIHILNNFFDLVLFASHYLEHIAKRNGVKIPIGILPIGLDLENFVHLSKTRFSPNTNKVRFGCVSAFHRRKGLDVLVDAFIEEFSENENVELIIHSNLLIDDTFQRLKRKIEKLKIRNITLSFNSLDDVQKAELFNSIDIFVNCSSGEGYSVGPREALALDKVLVLSALEPHKELAGVPGVFIIPLAGFLPARYPEIDHRVYGRQYFLEISDVKKALNEALSFLSSKIYKQTKKIRQERAAQFSFSTLSFNYAEVINPFLRHFRKTKKGSQFTHLPLAVQEIARKKLGKYASLLNTKNRIVMPPNDGGFFSVFNVFISTLTWKLLEERCHMVLPDWDIGRLVHKMGRQPISFCYGSLKEGNIWVKLFEPLYELSAEEMNDVNFLYGKQTVIGEGFNEECEPLLTYTYAYDLYKSPSFKYFRFQYHEVFRKYVHLLPNLQKEIDTFVEKNFTGKFIISLHVKHPSHMIEQPDGKMPHYQAFIDAVFNQLKSRKISLEDSSWGIFLATDQDRAVAHFKEIFGDRLIFFSDVRRTRIAEDELYDSLSPEEKAAEGYQVQHIVSASQEDWSSRMAWEVYRDAMVMSKGNVLLHVVSNVSTAVSYFNPHIELVFVDENAARHGLAEEEALLGSIIEKL